MTQAEFAKLDGAAQHAYVRELLRQGHMRLTIVHKLGLKPWVVGNIANQMASDKARVDPELEALTRMLREDIALFAAARRQQDVKIAGAPSIPPHARQGVSRET